MRTRTVIAAGEMAYGQGGGEVVLLYSEELMGHSRKVGGDAFAEAYARLGLGLVATVRHDLL